MGDVSLVGVRLRRGSGEVDRAIREFLAYSGGIYSAAECERMVRLAPNGIAAW